MANSADPDQLASLKPTDMDLHCLQMQGISGFSRTRVNQCTQQCMFLCRNKTIDFALLKKKLEVCILH